VGTAAWWSDTELTLAYTHDKINWLCMWSLLCKDILQCARQLVVQQSNGVLRQQAGWPAGAVGGVEGWWCWWQHGG
jgi:hypothetical protein